MIIETKYKSDLTKTDILNTQTILYWRTKSKGEYLEINELGWGFIWRLIKRKLKKKIYLLVCGTAKKGKAAEYSIEFFSIK